MFTKKFICVISICLAVVLVYLPLVEAGEIKITNIKAKSGRAYEEGEGGLDVNVKYYMDRDYVSTAMPDEFIGAQWIMTGNDDKSSTGADFLTFEVDQSAAVWVAHDSRGEKEKGGTPPQWLSDEFEHFPDLKMEVTDGNMGFFTFWKKEFPKGEIVLGGNADPPAAGQGSNYVVLILPGENRAVKAQGKLGITWGAIKAR